MIIAIPRVAEGAGDLRAQAPLDATAAAADRFTLREFPSRPLADAIDDAIGMVAPQMDFTC